MDMVLVEIVSVEVDATDQLTVKMRFFTTNPPAGRVFVDEGHVTLAETEAADMVSFLNSVFPDNAPAT